jgi:hypothetical protein
MLYLLGTSKRWPPSTAAMRQRLNNNTHRNQRGAAKFSGLAAPPSVHLHHPQRARSSPSVSAKSALAHWLKIKRACVNRAVTCVTRRGWGGARGEG